MWYEVFLILKLINYLRSIMLEERLNVLEIVSIVKKLVDESDCEIFIKDFASKR